MRQILKSGSKVAKITTIVGARPQFIKTALVSKKLREMGFHEVIIHTGQHYDYNISKIFFDELNISEPDYHLRVGSGSHGKQTGLMLRRIEEVLYKETPNIVVVYGDTNSTLAGALAASKLNLTVAHIEAGLRSFNKAMPEEINRVLTDHVSSLLFCPTETSVRNLASEGVSKGVHLVGDVMYDSALYYSKLAEEHSTVLDRLGLHPKGYFLATIHRPQNTDNPDNLRSIIEALNELPLSTILPLHPRTKKGMVRNSILTNPSFCNLIPPVSYLDMLMLEKNARAILTDSGGVQKEAYFFEVPCITLRNETEWVETVESGWNILVGADKDRILSVIGQIDKRWPIHKNYYGDGNASDNIVKIIAQEIT
jgi:UDP-N-acetylglucosamine 2-epimerase (non-hydrolysing)